MGNLFVLLTEDNKVLMEMQYRHAIGETCWEIPRRMWDDDDPIWAAIQRTHYLRKQAIRFKHFEYLGRTCAPLPTVIDAHDWQPEVENFRSAT